MSTRQHDKKNEKKLSIHDVVIGKRVCYANNIGTIVDVNGTTIQVKWSNHTDTWPESTISRLKPIASDSDDDMDHNTTKNTKKKTPKAKQNNNNNNCLLYTSPSPRDS